MKYSLSVASLTSTVFDAPSCNCGGGQDVNAGIGEKTFGSHYRFDCLLLLLLWP